MIEHKCFWADPRGGIEEINKQLAKGWFVAHNPTPIQVAGASEQESPFVGSVFVVLGRNVPEFRAGGRIGVATEKAEEVAGAD